MGDLETRIDSIESDMKDFKAFRSMRYASDLL